MIRLATLLCALLLPLWAQAQTLDFNWRIMAPNGAETQFTLSTDAAAPCILQIQQFDQHPKHRLRLRRVADIRHFRFEAGQPPKLMLVLDISDTDAESRFRAWQLQSRIREGYRQINRAWSELGDTFDGRAREVKVQKIAHGLAALNRSGAFGSFFQNNYRETFFQFGTARYRFLPAQGFTLPMKNATQARNLAEVLTGHRARHCKI